MPAALSRKDVIAYVDREVETRAAGLRREVDSVIPSLLRHYGVESDSISKFAMNDVVFNCAKDLEKISIYQKDEVDPLKTFGYMAFWIRKVKPVEQATRNKTPFREVNEYLSLWLVVAMVSRHYKDVAKDNSARRAECAAVIEALQSLLGDQDRMNYLIHCLRTRTFGPHHYVIMLHQLVRSAA